MRIEIPFRYEVLHRKPRKRSDETAVVAGVLPVEIREVDRSALTTIMRYRLSHTRYVSLDLMMSKPVAELVEFEGETWRTAFLGYDRDEGPMLPTHLERPATTERMQETLSDLSRIHVREWHGEPLPSTVEEIGAKEILKDGRIAEEERLREAASGIVLCGGAVFVRCPEPVLEIASVEDPVGRRRPMAVPRPQGYETQGKEFLRADRAVEEADARTIAAAGTGRFDRELFLAAAPEVLRPDLLRYDDRAIAFRGIAGRIQTALKDLVGHSQAASAAYRKFSEGVAAMTDDPATVEKAAPALLAAARSVRELLAEKERYLGIERFIRIAEQDLVPRLRDAEAVAGRRTVFGEPLQARTVFRVPAGRGFDVRDLAMRLEAGGAVSASVVGEALEITVPEPDWEKAERVLAAAMDAVCDEIHPREVFAF